jgi:hypothetical protein
MMPKYSLLDVKISARKEMVDMFRDITNQHSVKEYWTLCNEQPDIPNSEINQMLELRIIKSKDQFHGVDFSKEIISENKKIHPEANWYCGDWENVIVENEFNPSLVYLDGIFLPSNMVTLVVSTFSAMNFSPVDSMVFVNFPMNNTKNQYSQYDYDLNKEINHSIRTNKWECEGGFDYNATGRTDMRTIAYRKVR